MNSDTGHQSAALPKYTWQASGRNETSTIAFDVPVNLPHEETVHTVGTQKAILVALTMASFSAFPIMGAMARHISAQDRTSALVVRVAIFATDQGRLDDYRDFIERHLFPTLRSVPGYAGTYLGRDPNSGQLISLSFWHSEADALAGEEAVGRAIRRLPQGSVPRPSNVAKYVIEYRDISETLSK